jgi:hypothetical protein
VACFAWEGFFCARFEAETINCLVLVSRAFSCAMSRSSFRVFERIRLLHFRIYVPGLFRSVSTIHRASSENENEELKIRRRTCTAGSGLKKTALRDSMAVEWPEAAAIWRNLFCFRAEGNVFTWSMWISSFLEQFNLDKEDGVLRCRAERCGRQCERGS